jgi:hypothetical protein
VVEKAVSDRVLGVPVDLQIHGLRVGYSDCQMFGGPIHPDDPGANDGDAPNGFIEGHDHFSVRERSSASAMPARLASDLSTPLFPWFPD